ncbi:MAG: DUF748 domain-containing protein [Candidatus Omnitrophica bacterium]|nr:DUF748 domain-containing protein [Candidatus Omnitrophota bacterium]
MRILRDTALILFVVFMGIVVLLHVWVGIKGKPFLLKELKSIFKDQHVTVESVKATFPFNLTIRKLAIGDFAKVDEIIAAGGAIDIFRKNFSISDLRLKGLTLNVESGKDDASSSVTKADLEQLPKTAEITIDRNNVKQLPEISLPPVTDTISPPKQKFLVISNILLERLTVTDGTINYTDRNISEKGIKFTLTDVFFDLQNFIYPPKSPVITSFDMTGRIPWGEGKERGALQVKGWVNLFKKDLQAKVKIDDIDGLTFYPYYAQWVNLENTRIQKAKLAFNSDVQGLNNEVTAECHLELKEIAFKPRSSEEEAGRAEKIAQMVIGFFKSMSGGKIVMDFSVKTKFDCPQFGFGDLKVAFEDKIQQARKEEGFGPEGVLKLPGKIIEGTVKGATGFSKALIDATFTVGKEFGNAIGDSFRKSQPEDKNGGAVSQDPVEKSQAFPQNEGIALPSGG